MDTLELLGTEQMCADIGVSYRLIDRAVRLGWLMPEVEARGSGSRRLWSHHEAAVARRITELTDAVPIDWSLACRLYAPHIRAGQTVQVEGDWGMMTVRGIAPTDLPPIRVVATVKASLVWNGGVGHLHAPDCRDLARVTHRDVYRHITLPAATAYEVARWMYADHVSDHGWSETTHPDECRAYWQDIASSGDITIMGCIAPTERTTAP